MHLILYSFFFTTHLVTSVPIFFPLFLLLSFTYSQLYMNHMKNRDRKKLIVIHLTAKNTVKLDFYKQSLLGMEQKCYISSSSISQAVISTRQQKLVDTWETTNKRKCLSSPENDSIGWFIQTQPIYVLLASQHRVIMWIMTVQRNHSIVFVILYCSVAKNSEGRRFAFSLLSTVLVPVDHKGDYYLPKGTLHLNPVFWASNSMTDL